MFLKMSSMRGVMQFEEEGEVGIQVALPSDLITLFSRLYLDNIPIPILVEGIVMSCKKEFVSSIGLWLGYPLTWTRFGC